MPSDLPPAEPADIAYPSAVPFTLVHLGCLAAVWTAEQLAARFAREWASLASHFDPHGGEEAAREAFRSLARRTLAASRSTDEIIECALRILSRSPAPAPA